MQDDCTDPGGHAGSLYILKNDTRVHEGGSFVSDEIGNSTTCCFSAHLTPRDPLPLEDPEIECSVKGSRCHCL